MDLSWRFDLWYQGLEKSPKDTGRVEALVIRPPAGGHGAREIVDRVRVTPEAGIEGDRWSVDEQRTGLDQISIVNIHVISSLAGPELERRALSGDNLHVDLDLTEENLPVGTLLEIGSALLVVSSQPHMPCKHFVERFGITAVKKVLRASKKGRRGRGVICMVKRAGEFGVGDAIHVVRGDSQAG
jgi:MOSC domain-containing protein YiiM